MSQARLSLDFSQKLMKSLLAGDKAASNQLIDCLKKKQISLSDIISELEFAIQTQGNAYAMTLRGYMHKEGQGGPVDFPAAIALYDRAIACGHADAMSNRAFMHKHGQGGPVNLAAAIDLYDRAIASGNVAAMFNRAHMHQHGQGGPVNFAAAIALYDRAIASRYAGAMSNRAFMHKHGQGGPVNLAAAIDLYDRAIASENAGAMNSRAHMHQHGQGGPVNLVAAIALYNRAIASGHADAMSNRAHMYQHGQGGPVNFPAAIALYDQAIASGNVAAMFNRAQMHHQGQGGPVNFAAAIALYDRAIASGSAGAMFNRAHMHRRGQGGSVDFPAAIDLYDRAIASGNVGAMNSRAHMHQHGQGGPADFPAAIALYDQAIAGGDAVAMFNRAIMHQQGQGGPVNLLAASKLYRSAIIQANKDGNGFLLLEVQKCFEQIKKAVPLNEDNAQIYYHIFMTEEPNNAWKNMPLNDFLACMEGDDLLSENERFQLLEVLLQENQDYKNKVHSIKALSLLNKYFYHKGVQYAAEKQYDQAIEYYQKLDEKGETLYKDANLNAGHIFMTLYTYGQDEKDKHHYLEAAFRFVLRANKAGDRTNLVNHIYTGLCGMKGSIPPVENVADNEDTLIKLAYVLRRKEEEIRELNQRNAELTQRLSQQNSALKLFANKRSAIEPLVDTKAPDNKFLRTSQ